MALGYHIMLRLTDGRVIAPTAPARLRLARTVLDVGRDYALLAFRGADSHVHIEAACSQREAGELARRIEISLSHKAGPAVGFERARVKQVEDQRHLGNLFDYCMRQEEHHGTALDPLFVASNLPDLLGMRLLGRFTIANVQRWLPRVTRSRLLSYLGCRDIDDAPIRMDDLVDAASAALAVSDLSGKGRATTAARRAAVHVASQHVKPADVGSLLDLRPRSVRQLRSQPVDEETFRAAQLQLRLRGALRWRADEALAG